MLQLPLAQDGEDHRRDDEDVQEAAHHAAVDAVGWDAYVRVMITVERVNGMTHITFPEAEVSGDRLKAFLDWLRQPQAERITSLEPLPRAEWERVYSQADEFSAVSAEQLVASQVREEPQ